MDFNELYHRHQVSLMRADIADCSSSRLAHLALASAYAERIAVAKAAPRLALYA